MSSGPDHTGYCIHSEGEPTNEIEDYIQARYLSAPEAAQRILGYDVIGKEPSVTCLPVHLPGQSRALRHTEARGDTASLLDCYFLCPPHLAHL